MNPATKAVTRLEQIDRARMIARTLPARSVAGYCRRVELPRVDQLTAAAQIKQHCGAAKAAEVMRALGWSIEAALLTILGPTALERHLDRLLDHHTECCA